MVAIHYVGRVYSKTGLHEFMIDGRWLHLDDDSNYIYISRVGPVGWTKNYLTKKGNLIVVIVLRITKLNTL